MKKLRLSMAALVALTIACPAFAQTPPGMDIAEAMAKLFGDHKAFTTTMHTTINAVERGDVTMDVNYSMLDGKVRADVDMATAKGTAIPEAAVAQAKMMGMDRIFAIVRTDKKVVYNVFPGLKSYV